MSALYRSAVRAVRIGLLEPVDGLEYQCSPELLIQSNRAIDRFERPVYSFIPQFELVDLLLCKSKRPVMSPWLRRESRCSHLVRALRVLRAVPV